MLIKDGEPFHGATYINYFGSATQTRFLDMINGTDKDLSLNLSISL